MVVQLFHAKNALLPNNSGKHMTSQNPKWRCTGKLKGDNINSIFHLLLLNDIFTLPSKIGDLVITSNNSKPTYCKSGGFLQTRWRLPTVSAVHKAGSCKDSKHKNPAIHHRLVKYPGEIIKKNVFRLFQLGNWELERFYWNVTRYTFITIKVRGIPSIIIQLHFAEYK